MYHSFSCHILSIINIKFNYDYIFSYIINVQLLLTYSKGIIYVVVFTLKTQQRFVKIKVSK